MKTFVNCVRDFLLLISLVTICSANSDSVDDGFLNVTCNESSDCYVLENVNQGLWLACWHNVHKCKCQNTISSDYNLKWEHRQCLMSKYGPCGGKGELKVGCQDGFVCVDNQCRDPNDTNPKSVKVTPYIFDGSKCSENGCSFSDEMDLRCNYETNQCECAKVYIADARDSFWDIRNYDGNKNCSIGKFGPCGTKNGITIECHGEGITCVDGTCLNADHKISEVSEDCASTKNCKEGLLCSLNSICIEKFSLSLNEICNGEEECQKGLQCRHRPEAGPWSFAVCQKTISARRKYDETY